MKKILMPLADGFEEIETITIVDVIRRAGLSITIAGLKSGELVGAHDIRVMSDQTLDEVKEESFDMIVLPGGQPGVDNLRKDQRVLDLLKKMKKSNKVIGAICAAPLALRDAGLISGVKLTSYPSIEQDLSGSQYLSSRVVVDGNLVTSRGPGTAMDFALKLVELLLGKKQSEQVSQALLAHQT